MAPKASQVDSGAPAETSLDISDKKHGSAAGSVLQTGDVATAAALASTPRDVSPLGQGNINDDALPAGKRRAVSRKTPTPPPGVIPPGAHRQRSRRPLPRPQLRRLDAWDSD